MDGNKVYENKFSQKIENIINNNPSADYLRGYSNFIGKSAYSTIYNYMNYVLGFMKSCNKLPETLVLDDYTAYINSLRNEGASYQITVYSALKKFSAYLYASKRNLDNPMQFIERPKFKESQSTKEKREKGYLKTKEIQTYMNTVQMGVGTHKARARQEKWKNRDKLILEIFLNTGMRCSALYKLDVTNINFEQRTLVTIDKGDKIQVYDLSNELLNQIHLWLRQRENILNGVNENALFISNQKRRMDQASIAKVVNKYGVGIKGKNITPHKLRATYGTHLYEQTGDIYFVQECMSHSSPKVTELYIRGQKGNTRKKAADIMSTIINKK